MNTRYGAPIVSALLALSGLGSLACSNDAGPSSDKNVGTAGSSNSSKSQQSGSAGSSGKGGSGGTNSSSGGASGGKSASSSAGSGGSSSSSSGGGGSSRSSSGGSTSSGGSSSSKGGSSGSSSASSASGGTTVASSAMDAGIPDTLRADATSRDTNTRDTRTADVPSVVVGDGGLSSKTGDDGCTDVLANLTLQEIAVYQSLKIPIMTAGSEVPAASRKNAIIVGRDTMFRVFVNVGSGWAARDLSARLTLTPAGGQATRYYAKQSVTESSTDGKLASTFAIYVPASAMTGEMRYSLQVVECSNTSDAGKAQFPASGDTDLGIKTTGGLKIKIIPIKIGNLLPDTSESALATYASTMNAMFPITTVSFSVGDTMTASSPFDWTGTLEQLRSKRAKDAPAADVYYFALVKPADTLRAYCGSGCTSGIGYVVTNASMASGRAAIGVGFADKASTFTMAHEVGHNHGRQHSPCVPAGGSITGVDPNYPTANAGLAVWGWDPRTLTLFDPTKSSSSSDKTKYTNTDIMGYCNTQWISDYTYAGITTRVASVNGVKAHSTSAVVSKWRVLLIDDKGPRWGIPFDTEVPAEGEPELATALDAHGAALETIVVYRTEIGDMDASMVWVPAPKPEWYSVQVGNVPPHPFSAPVAVPRP